MVNIDEHLSSMSFFVCEIITQVAQELLGLRRAMSLLELARGPRWEFFLAIEPSWLSDVNWC